MTEPYYQPLINPKFVQAYGAMPTDWLVAKFDQTITGDDDDNDEMTWNFMRGEIVDYGPNDPLFEHEEARRTTNRADVLNIREHGNRGEYDIAVQRPEIFLDHGGEGDHDRQQVDPDFRKLTNENAVRNRYVNYGKDMSDFVIDGNRAPAREIEDRQKMYKSTKQHLKVFSQQRDGKRNGQYRSFQHASTVRKQRGEDVQVGNEVPYKDYAIESGNSEEAYTDDKLALNEYIGGDITNTGGGRYNDQLLDAALTPQNSRSYKVGQELGPNSYSRSTVDGEFDVQSYSHIKHHKHVSMTKGRSHAEGSTADSVMQDDHNDKYAMQVRMFKRSMKNLAQMKADIAYQVKNGDLTLAESVEIERNIMTRFVRNGEAMNEIAKYVVTSGDFDDTMGDGANKKTAKLVALHGKYNLNYTTSDAEREAEYVKFQIRRLSKQGNLAGINKMTVANVDTDEFFDIQRSTGRKKVKVRTGSHTKTEGDRGEEFKIAKIGANSRVKKGSKTHLRYQRDGESFGSEGDETKLRKLGKHKLDNGETARESHNTQFMSENKYINRHGGKMGNKYMVNFQERDNKGGDTWEGMG